jgi:hypothetical protein
MYAGRDLILCGVTLFFSCACAPKHEKAAKRPSVGWKKWLCTARAEVICKRTKIRRTRNNPSGLHTEYPPYLLLRPNYNSTAQLMRCNASIGLDKNPELDKNMRLAFFISSGPG